MTVEGRRPPVDLPTYIDGRVKIPWNHHGFIIPPELISHPTEPMKKEEIASGQPVELSAWLTSEEMLRQLIGDRPFRIGRYINRLPPNDDTDILSQWVKENIQIQPFLEEKAEFQLEQFYDSFMGHGFDDPAFKTHCAFQIAAPKYKRQFRWLNADEMMKAAVDLRKRSVWVTPFDDERDATLAVYNELTFIHHTIEERTKKNFSDFFTPIFIEALRYQGFSVNDNLTTNVRIFLPRGTEERIIPSLKRFWNDPGSQPTGFFSFAEIVSIIQSSNIIEDSRERLIK